VLYNAYLAGQEGGLTPEFFLFLFFFLIFGSLWLYLRGTDR
jgi:hypothetical protein